MTKPPASQPIQAAVAKAPATAAPVKAAAAVELLDGGEIIQLSIRPSPWCIALYSWKLVVAAVVVAAALYMAQGQASLGASLALLAVMVGVFAVTVATLHWASQLYVLTNRRVLCFRGLFSVDVGDLSLTQIAEVRPERAWFHPPLRLGSLCMLPSASDKAPMRWEHVARPAEIQEILTQAIARSRPR